LKRWIFKPMAILTAIAMMLIVAGFIGYNKRDMEG
jgi:putative exporter of polyketide antibiotics